MRVYDYKCPNCQHIQESFIRNDTDEVLCNKCQTPADRLISSPCFVLTGVGVTSRGTFKKALDGPYLDPELLSMPEDQFNKEVGYSLDG